MLSVRELSKKFGGIKAVHACSFEVQRGSITGLIGPNGAGKTTLFDLVSGFLRPDAGEVWFDGRRIDGLPAHAIARLGLVRTFQIPRELKGMTVLENLMLARPAQRGERLLCAWFSPRAVRREEETFAKAQSVLEFLGLKHLAREYAGNLSVGQKKLLEIGRGLMAEPKMVLLDEPAAGVNPSLMHQIVEYIKELQRNGVTFLLIEHNMDVVMNVCDKVVVMSQGARLAEGSPEEIRRDPAVLEAYLGGAP